MFVKFIRSLPALVPSWGYQGVVLSSRLFCAVANNSCHQVCRAVIAEQAVCFFVFFVGQRSLSGRFRKLGIRQYLVPCDG